MDDVGGAVAQCARAWVGTRFHHQGRVRKSHSNHGGVDCLGLLIGIADEIGLRDASGKLLCSYDEHDYGHYPDEARLEAMLGTVLQCVPIADLRRGDICLIEVDGRAQHLAVVSSLDGELSLIHAYAPVRAVVEHHLDDAWRRRIRKAYRFCAYTN